MIQWLVLVPLAPPGPELEEDLSGVELLAGSLVPGPLEASLNVRKILKFKMVRTEKMFTSWRG